ncbi:MAG: TRAP transporter large permease [Nitrososphaerales archaeon]
MDPILLSILFFTISLIFLLSGMPIAFALGFVALLFMFIFWDPLFFKLIAQHMFDGLNDFGLIAIPLFILLGVVMGETKASEDLYEAVHRWLYKIPGGIGVTNIVSCAIFAALCGSSPATAAAIGKMGIPEMLKRGYDPRLATGVIAAGGTLGILIPPSVTMIVYGIATETSIGKLFIAGVIPGIILTLLFSLWTIFAHYRYIHSKRINPSYTLELSVKEYTLREKLIVLPKVLPFIIIIFLIMYSLYFGFATPSEAAGVGAIAAIFVTMIIYKVFKGFLKIFEVALKDTVMIMVIMATAHLYSVVMSNLWITQTLANALINLNLPPWGLILLVNLLLLLLGCFLPPVVIILIICPIIHPAILAAGFDPIWFGVMITINMEAGLITPPVGLNLYVIKRIAPEIPMSDVLKGSIPFIIIMFIGMVLLYLFPQLALWLPSQMITR